MLSYACARSLASILDHETQMGPLFVEGKLIFTSLDAQDNSKILLVNAGAGNFVVPLVGQGVNRIRFDLPVAGERMPRRFFLSYMHGERMRSRYFEFSEEHPPIGKEATDFQNVKVSRAQNLLPHLNYAIYETTDVAISALTDGSIGRGRLQGHKIERCDELARQSPRIGQLFKRNVDMLEIFATGVHSASRMPASIR